MKVQDLFEAPFKLKDKVKIVGGPRDLIGIEGHIGEIRSDVVGRKTFTVDYYLDSKPQMHSIMLKSNQIRKDK